MEIPVDVKIELTPKMMAKIFWGMYSDEQAAFFEALGKEIGDDTFHAQVQWFYLEEELRKNALAKDTFMDMAAPMFWQTLKFMEKV